MILGNGAIALSSSVLDFAVNDDAGARQHVIRNAWRAWCLHKHCQSIRRDCDLDCFDNGVFRRIDWDGVRKFAASGPEARAVATGGSLSPAAFHSAQNLDVDDTCIWPGCHNIGTFHHIVWTSPCRPCDMDIPPRPGEVLMARFGWSFLVRLLMWIVFMLGLCLCNVAFGISGMVLSAMSGPAHVCPFAMFIFGFALFSPLLIWGWLLAGPRYYVRGFWALWLGWWHWLV